LFFQAEGGIRVFNVTGVQTCALPIYLFPSISKCSGCIRKASTARLMARKEAFRILISSISWGLANAIAQADAFSFISSARCFLRSEERRVVKEDRARR